MKRVVKSLIQALPFRRQIFEVLRQWPLPAWVYRHLHFTGPIKVRGRGGKPSFLMWHWGNQIENDLFWAGYGHGWEAVSLRLWQVLAEDARYIADIGANTGVYALSAASVSPAATILAVEPVRRIFEKLQTNVALNGYSIILEGRAASAEAGTAIMYDPEGAHAYSASLDPDMLGEAMTRKIEIATAPLDALMAEHGLPRLDLVKIDVERHEPQVLDGMAATLRRDHPTILIEIRTAAWARALRRVLRASGTLCIGLTKEPVRPALTASRADRVTGIFCCVRAMSRPDWPTRALSTWPDGA